MNNQPDIKGQVVQGAKFAFVLVQSVLLFCFGAAAVLLFILIMAKPTTYPVLYLFLGIDIVLLAATAVWFGRTHYRVRSDFPAASPAAPGTAIQSRAWWKFVFSSLFAIGTFFCIYPLEMHFNVGGFLYFPVYALGAGLGIGALTMATLSRSTTPKKEIVRSFLLVLILNVVAYGVLILAPAVWSGLIEP